MIRALVLALSALFLPGQLAGEELPASITQRANGEIFFPITAATRSTDGTLSWKYKPTRWGMYDIEWIFTRAATLGKVSVEITGETFDAEGEMPENYGEDLSLLPLGRFYLATANPFDLHARANQNGALKAIRLRPAPEGQPIRQEGDQIVLHARDATTHSVMMRYEPAPNKNCLGFWTNPNDAASWRFEATKPGTYEIELWQGCGKGQGGSEVAVEMHWLPSSPVSSRAGPVKRTTFVVEDTGHFQNFIPRNLGEVRLPEAAPYVLIVRPVNKKAAAVMDIRQIILKPAAGKE